MVATGCPMPVLLAGSSLQPLLATTVRLALYLAVGAWAFGAPVGRANLVSATLVLGLGIACAAGLGLLSAAFILVHHRGDPVTAVVSAVSGLLAGVLFPVELLPRPLELLAQLLPFTHALEGLRLAVLRGASPSAVGGSCLSLVVLAAVLLPLGWTAFRRGLERARREGTLTRY